MNKSELRQWPLQIKLIDENHQSFNDNTLLVAADCTAFAYADFHKDFIKDKITIIGCPKLDDADYSIKLTEIFNNNSIKEVVVVRMEVPCCTGLEMMVKRAIENSEKNDIELKTVVIGLDGEIRA